MNRRLAAAVSSFGAAFTTGDGDGPATRCKHDVHRSARHNRYLVADGAMGTTLFSLGSRCGGCPELLNVEEGDLVEKVHRSFIEAGADIVLTNTFGGNRLRLDLHELEDRVAELNRAAIAVARRAARSSRSPGSRRGERRAHRRALRAAGTSPPRGVEVFGEQCQALADAGAT